MWCPCNYTEITSLNCCLSSKVPSSNITESCSNYTFSEPFILNFNSIRGGCTDLVFLNSSNSHALDRTHHLTARWPSVNLSMSGAEVVCAQASSGITQLARTATLMVLPASPTMDGPYQSKSLSWLSFLTVLLALIIGGVTVSAVSLWWRHRRRSVPNTSRQFQLEQSEPFIFQISSSVVLFLVFYSCSFPSCSLPSI